MGVLELDDALDATDEVDKIPVDGMVSIMTVMPSKPGRQSYVE